MGETHMVPESSSRRARVRLDSVLSVALAAVVLLLLLFLVVLVAAPSVVAGTAAKAADARPGWRLPAGAVVNLEPASLVEVVDGDTAFFRLDDGSIEKVRMVGIDAPEMGDGGDGRVFLSKQYAEALLVSQPGVYLERGVKQRDRHGQLLAYVWLSRPTAQLSEAEVRREMLNARMLIDGYAIEFPREPGVVYPNDRYSELFSAFHREARDGQRGTWDPAFVAQASAGGALWNASGGERPGTAPYVGNASSRKFHQASCENAAKMRYVNRMPLDSRDEAVELGFVACGVCDP